MLINAAYLEEFRLQSANIKNMFSIYMYIHVLWRTHSWKWRSRTQKWYLEKDDWCYGNSSHLVTTLLPGSTLFFFFARITVSHLFDARLQPPCSCPSWKRNLNDTCLECSPLRVALRAAKIVYGREGNCKPGARFSRIFIKYDWFLLASPRPLKYVFSTLCASIFQSSRTSETIVFNMPYRFIKIPLHAPKNTL